VIERVETDRAHLEADGLGLGVRTVSPFAPSDRPECLRAIGLENFFYSHRAFARGNNTVPKCALGGRGGGGPCQRVFIFDMSRAIVPR
jgi:hypothetical protein